MGDKVDMALDDIIKSTKGSNRGSRRGGGGNRSRGRGRGGRSQGRPGSGRGSFRSGISNGQNRSGMSARRWAHDMFQGQGGPRPLSEVGGVPPGPYKVNVSNLDFGVSDSDIRELFQEFGELKNAAIHYDKAGRSLGSAQVVFSRFSDAQKAVKQYDRVHLDGRPMKIYMEGGNSMRGMGGSAPRPLIKRLNQARVGAGRGSGRGGRGNRGGRGGRGSGRDKPKPKTAEELDAELDSYVSEAKKDTTAA